MAVVSSMGTPLNIESVPPAYRFARRNAMWTAARQCVRGAAVECPVIEMAEMDAQTENRQRGERKSLE